MYSFVGQKSNTPPYGLNPGSDEFLKYDGNDAAADGSIVSCPEFTDVNVILFNFVRL